MMFTFKLAWLIVNYVAVKRILINAKVVLPFVYTS